MREIVLDTETTGFDPESGDRIGEIGALELYNHLPTGETFHVWIFSIHSFNCIPFNQK